MELFCSHCKCDAAYRADPDDAIGCPILAASFAFSIDEPGYPKEWVRDVGSPVTLIGGNGARCTAFVEEGKEIPYRCPNTKDMFE